MDLRVDDSAMKSLVAKAIVDSLSPEAREKLIGDAVTQTLTQPQNQNNSYGSKRSPLQQAFDYAVEGEARKYAAEIIAADGPFKEQLRKLFEDVSRKVFEAEGRDKMVDDIASTIVRALTKDRY